MICIGKFASALLVYQVERIW